MERLTAKDRWNTAWIPIGGRLEVTYPKRIGAGGVRCTCPQSIQPPFAVGPDCPMHGAYGTPNLALLQQLQYEKFRLQGLILRHLGAQFYSA